MKNLRNQPVYKHPFSREYWRDAASQLFDVRILCIAAILIAVRVALKSVQIPVGASLNITVGFFVNALGASIFGPVVAIVAAAISDTLGCLIFPQGAYFFPFIFEEISGSLLFALVLWRSNMTASRVIFSRFSVVAITNLIINPTLMMWYYDIFYGKSYAFMTVPRVVKNLALFPAESLLLVLFMGAMVPIAVKLGLMVGTGVKPILTKKHLVMLGVFFIIAALIVVGYYSLFIPTQPQSESLTDGSIKITVKADRGTYRLDSVSEETPMTLSATLKNNGKTDVTAKADADAMLLLKLVPLSEGGAVVEPAEFSAKGDLLTVKAGESLTVTGTYYFDSEQLETLYRGEYHVLAQAVLTVDGEDKLISSALEIKLK